MREVKRYIILKYHFSEYITLYRITGAVLIKIII